MAKQTKAESARYINGKIRSGIRALLGDPKYDWKLESEEICFAAAALTQSEVEYAAGKTTEDEVKAKYKAYVALHEVGQTSLIGAEL